MAEMQMDPELAKRLFFEGATVIILNVPEGTEFGIDYNSWQVGPKFRGVKMIPPGIHFLHYSSVDKNNKKESGPRTGFFLNLQQRDLRILYWNREKEEVDLTPASDDETNAMRANLQEMDKFLGPYPYDTLKKWISLTNFINEPVMQKLQPESGQICAFSEVLPVLPGKYTKDRVEQNLPRYDTECKSYAEGLARLPKMQLKAGTEIRFTEIPKQMYPKGATPEEVTRHSMDLSYALETVINKQYASNSQDVLGELQFAFICFLIGNVYDAFEHWKKLLNLLCRSEDAITKHQALYGSLISVLYHQLSEIPPDFFVDIVSHDNFLTNTLQVFFSYTCSPAVDRTLRKKAERFKAHLTKKFKWDFEAEPEDCAPVVVELPEDKMSAKRKSYSVEYKKRIVEDSYGKNLAAYCKEKMLDLRLVRKWRADYIHLSQQVDMGNAKKRKCGSGRQTLFPDLEDIVCEWIADRRAKTLVVRRADIQAFALEMAPTLDISPEEFKASQHWLDNFLQRYELSLRRSTTLFKLEDAEVVKRAIAFKSFVDGIDFSKYQLSNMIAMDETAVFMGHRSQTTINQRSASSIYTPSTGYEGARVTCILAIRLDGKKVTPLIISKGKKDKIERVSGVYVLESEKAWCTQAVIRKWVDLMLPHVLQGGQRGLLVWDSASTHRAKDMKNFLAERRIDQIVIPAGMTAYLQTLDIGIHKPFKDHLHVEINDFIENRLARDQHGNLVKPGLQEVVTWVKKSWDKITDASVAHALQAGYLDKKCSFKETTIARHERLGSMVLKEMELQENQARIQDLNGYDDVPEEDDMTVFE